MRDSSPPARKVYQWGGPGREDEPLQAELGIMVEKREALQKVGLLLAE